MSVEPVPPPEPDRSRGQRQPPPSRVLHPWVTDVIRARQIGERVRRARQQLGLSVAGLADVCGLDAHTVGAIERGRRPIRVEDLKKIVKHLAPGLSLRRLVPEALVPLERDRRKGGSDEPRRPDA